MKCECTTSKKAWANPLAPMAKCKQDAKFIVHRDKNVMFFREAEDKKVCAAHKRQLLSRGDWRVVGPITPEPAP